ncbi:MAG TPA: HAD-IC family P-type ATPase, partial [Chloroflexota bacterium]|nr:HAD-IC family P-type ATPase [Chloroflexota bacterium]
MSATDPTIPAAERRWYTQPIDAIETELGTSLIVGLSPTEASARARQLGPNTLERAKVEPWWEEVVESLTEPLVLLLLVVAVLYAVLGSLGDALTILAVILLVAAVEVMNESRAKRAIVSLRTLAAPVVPTVRDGQLGEIPARELVPGDLVLLSPGERVPADLRLVETAGLQVDEASLTGESVPVAKEAEITMAPDTELADRRNLAFAGTLITTGRGRCIVVAIGPATELGRIARLSATTRESRTPLQVYLRQLAGWLLWLAVGFSILIPLLAVVVAGRPFQESLLTGLTLAFATIPEELPILVTIVLGLGSYRLARR